MHPIELMKAHASAVFNLRTAKRLRRKSCHQERLWREREAMLRAEMEDIGIYVTIELKPKE